LAEKRDCISQNDIRLYRTQPTNFPKSGPIDLKDILTLFGTLRNVAIENSGWRCAVKMKFEG